MQLPPPVSSDSVFAVAVRQLLAAYKTSCSALLLATEIPAAPGMRVQERSLKASKQLRTLPFGARQRSTFYQFLGRFLVSPRSATKGAPLAAQPMSRQIFTSYGTGSLLAAGTIAFTCSQALL